MNPVYPDYQRIYAYLNDVRTNITSRVIGDITGGGWGIMSNKSIDRVAQTGWLKFVLNDYDGIYTPGSLTATAGWEKGIAIELEISFEDHLYLFRFYIKDITPPSGAEDIRTLVDCVDWLDYAAEHPIENPGVLANQYANEVVQTALDLMPIPPLSTDLQQGINLFPATFDTVSTHTKVYDEIIKATLSELSYSYLIHDKVYGETLVLENADARNGLRELDNVPIPKSESGFILKPDGDYLLKADGFRLILNKRQPAVIDNKIIDAHTTYGNHQINHYSLQANPRRIDTSAQILFQLDAPFVIAPGKTFELRGTYADPNGGQSINAQDMIVPVITTDYLGNTNSLGTGTNISADLVVVSNYYSSDFVHQLANNNGSPMWITKFNCRGYGIYIRNPIRDVSKDEASILRFGAITETLDQKYKDDIYAAIVFSTSEVDREAYPRVVLNKVSVCANYDPILMLSFLTKHPGDLLQFVIDKHNIDGYYYIQGIDGIRISTGGVIMFDWWLKETRSLSSGLSPIALEFFDDNDVIDFGYIPRISNLEKRSYTFWIEVNELDDCFILGSFLNGAGVKIQTNFQGKLQFIKATDQYGIDPQWSWTSDDALTINTLQLVVITHDVSNGFDTEPIFYIDAVDADISVTDATGFEGSDETGTHFLIGGASDDTTRTVKDIRVYNRILSQSEITALYNAGVPDVSLVTDGLLFQAPAVKTEELADYIDETLTDDLKIIDSIHGAIGIPSGSVIARTF